MFRSCFGYGGGEPYTEEVGTSRRRHGPVPAIEHPDPGDVASSTSPFSASDASGSPSDGATTASPSAAPSLEGTPSPVESAASFAGKFFGTSMTVVEGPEEEELAPDAEEQQKESFLEDYEKAVETFDADADVSERFFRGIDDPDAFTEVAPRGVELVLNADGQTWDAYIRKVPNAGHQHAVAAFLLQLGLYVTAMSLKYSPELSYGGGHHKSKQVVLPNGDVIPERRTDPDAILRIGDGEPRVVIEVELSNRRPLALAQHVHALMLAWPLLCCVIGLKIYRRIDGLFAVVCFVWKKRRDGSIYVERVFDIGPRASEMKSRDAVAEFWTENNVDFSAVYADDGKSFDVAGPPKALPYPLPRLCPTELKRYFTLDIGAADVFRDVERMALDDDAPAGPPEKKARLDALDADAVDADALVAAGVFDNFGDTLRLNLFDVVRELDKCKGPNFNSMS